MDSELMVLLVPLIRALLALILAVLLFFVYEGFREFRKYGPIKGRFRLQDLSWDNAPLTVTGSVVFVLMFFAGLGGAYGITVWAGSLSRLGELQHYLIGVWFLALAASVALLVASFTRVLVLGAVVGYWLAWKLRKGLHGETKERDRL